MRTEEQVFNDFKELGYVVEQDINGCVFKNKIYEYTECIIVGRKRKWYCKKTERAYYLPISLTEHKLLHELFEIWGWL